MVCGNFGVQRYFVVIGIGITTQHLLVIKAEPLPVTQTEERIRERERWEVAIVVVLADTGREKV
jgi:hypothetical protein